MRITETVDELLDLLIEISDSDDFVRAVVGAAGNDANRKRTECLSVLYKGRKLEGCKTVTEEGAMRIIRVLIL